MNNYPPRKTCLLIEICATIAKNIQNKRELQRKSRRKKILEKEQNRKFRKIKRESHNWFGSDVIILHIGLWTNKTMSLTEFNLVYSNVHFSYSQFSILTMLMHSFHVFCMLII